ncbi:hypothetical protein, partial [Actinoplanes awajinensis]|uniref:hypothetical protein n=1 Tax=Actinoplanes awajinensis TaxID=135946 RepID=UPI000AAB2442
MNHNYLLTYVYDTSTGIAFGSRAVSLDDPIASPEDIEILTEALAYQVTAPKILAFSRFDDNDAVGG